VLRFRIFISLNEHTKLIPFADFVEKKGRETPSNSWRGVLGELIGVMFLVLFGCGSVTASNFFLNDGVAKSIFIAGSFGYIVCM
jgi:hypothetical protein